MVVTISRLGHLDLLILYAVMILPLFHQYSSRELMNILYNSSEIMNLNAVLNNDSQDASVFHYSLPLKEFYILNML